MMKEQSVGGGTFRNPIYSGTSADSTAIEAVYNLGYRSADTGNTNRTGMQATCWNSFGRCWTSPILFSAGQYSTITAVFQRREGSVTRDSYCVLVVSEKVKDLVVAKGSYSIDNMSETYGDYLYAKVDTNANGTYTASIDLSGWKFQNGFYVSCLYKNGVDGNYMVARVNSITLS